MDRLDHLEHLDKELVDELAQVARETVRDELREQTRRQRRRAMLYGASGAVALYAGAALALALGLGLAAALPDWAAALITAGILGVVAYVLRGAARPSASRPTSEREAELAHGRTPSGAPAAAPGGMPYPPVPPVPPGTGMGAPGAPLPGTPGAAMPEPPEGRQPRPDDIDPEQPHHRA
ncbi:phage holin family protein [Streptomyces sp. CA-251387]|uniref:phage holin family protein n=1 Tax=Streptomyces sp. CA-251387 TaxID=3240064 RepID=UPI003D8E1380